MRIQRWVMGFALFVGVSLPVVVGEAAADAQAPPAGSVYVAVAPCRVADSRSGGGLLMPGSQRVVQVSGAEAGFETQGGKAGGCGIPVGATAAEVSVSAVAPTGTGFLRVWPSDEGAPMATFVNYARSQATTNTGTIALGGAGAVKVSAFSGATQVVVDVQGYYKPVAPGARFVSLAPCRIADTRAGGGPPVAEGSSRQFQVTGSSPVMAAQGGRAGGCEVPAGAVAAEVSISAVTPDGNGFARVWPSDIVAPTATFVNYARSQATTNSGTVPLGGAGAVKVGAFSAATHVVVDVQGYFTTSGLGSRYVPVAPCRIVDTRSNGSGPLAAGASRQFQVTGTSAAMASQGGRPGGCRLPSGAVASEASVSAVAPSGSGFTRVWPADDAAPTATQVNYANSHAITNTGAVALTAGGAVKLANFGGTAHYVIDVVGYFAAPGVPPVISSLVPGRGAPGDTITLTGSGFGDATEVVFDDFRANFSVVDDSTLTAVVPYWSSSGFVTVTAPGGTATSKVAFTVVPPASDLSPPADLRAVRSQDPASAIVQWTPPTPTQNGPNIVSSVITTDPPTVATRVYGDPGSATITGLQPDVDYVVEMTRHNSANVRSALASTPVVESSAERPVR